MVATYSEAQISSPVDGVLDSHRPTLHQGGCLALDRQSRRTVNPPPALRRRQDSSLRQTRPQSSRRHPRPKHPITSEVEPVLEAASLLAI